MANVKFVAPRVPLVDPRSGIITREWYLLFSSLFANVDGGNGTPDPEDDPQSLAFAAPDPRVDALFQEGAVPASLPTFASQIASLEQLSVMPPEPDSHRRIDELEMLIASLAPTQQGQQSASGTYTPTITPGTNAAAATLVGTPRWMRIGKIILVSGVISATATAAGVATAIGIALPFSSALTLSHQITGNATTQRIQQSGAVDADVPNLRANMQYIAADTNPSSMFFNFTYEVL